MCLYIALCAHVCAYMLFLLRSEKRDRGLILAIDTCIYICLNALKLWGVSLICMLPVKIINYSELRLKGWFTQIQKSHIISLTVSAI